MNDIIDCLLDVGVDLFIAVSVGEVFAEIEFEFNFGKTLDNNQSYDSGVHRLEVEGFDDSMIFILQLKFAYFTEILPVFRVFYHEFRQQVPLQNLYVYGVECSQCFRLYSHILPLWGLVFGFPSVF